jgi:hypothetical protein
LFKKNKCGYDKNPKRFEDIGVNDNGESESAIAWDENAMNILSLD